MRRSLCCLAVAVVVLAGAASAGAAQDEERADSTGLPGDHFSLQGALEMFKKAGSPEEFEKLINTADNHVNNLDLNGDGEVDYIRVVGMRKDDSHVFVLQVPVSENESQDIAVIEMEKTGPESVVLQIVGDEDIYGEATIVEPSDEEGESDQIPAGEQKEKGPRFVMAAPPAPPVVVNVWAWPSVRFVYAPGYVVWVSPWRWRAYPGWWHPWRPLAWRAFHPFRARYHRGFAVVGTRRVVHAHRIYAPVRRTSVTVRTRHGAVIKHHRTTVRTREGVKVRRSTTVRRKPR
jgi:hypothetical protein